MRSRRPGSATCRGKAYAAGRARHISVCGSGDTLTLRLVAPSSSRSSPCRSSARSRADAGRPGGLDVASRGPVLRALARPGRSSSPPQPELRRHPGAADALRIAFDAGQTKTLDRVEEGEVDYTPSATTRGCAAAPAPLRAGSPAAGGRQRYFVTRTVQSTIWPSTRAGPVPFRPAAPRGELRARPPRARPRRPCDRPAGRARRPVPPAGHPRITATAASTRRARSAEARRLAGTGAGRSPSTRSRAAAPTARRDRRGEPRPIGIDVRIREHGDTPFVRLRAATSRSISRWRPGTPTTPIRSTSSTSSTAGCS